MGHREGGVLRYSLLSHITALAEVRVAHNMRRGEGRGRGGGLRNPGATSSGSDSCPFFFSSSFKLFPSTSSAMKMMSSCIFRSHFADHPDQWTSMSRWGYHIDERVVLYPRFQVGHAFEIRCMQSLGCGWLGGGVQEML